MLPGSCRGVRWVCPGSPRTNVASMPSGLEGIQRQITRTPAVTALSVNVVL